MARPKLLETIAKEAFNGSCLNHLEVSRIVGGNLEIIHLQRRGESQIKVAVQSKVAVERVKGSDNTDSDTSKNGLEFQGYYAISEGHEVKFYGSRQAYLKLLSM
jgi:hypothetical protein